MSKILNGIFAYLADNVPALVKNSIIAYGHDSIDSSTITATQSQTQNGVTGTWTYRMWNNGFFDCWGTFTMIPIEDSGSPAGEGKIHYSKVVYVPLPPSINTSYYEKSQDTTVDSSKTYYILNDNIYEVVTNPTGNPNENDYYERLDTHDRIKGEAIVDNMTQWVVNAGMTSTAVTVDNNPVFCYGFRTARPLTLATSTSSKIHITLHGEYVPVSDYSGGSGGGDDPGGGGGGGSGGVTNYALLTNKPRIEGIELIGNQTFSDLTLQSLTEQEILTLIQEVSEED